MYADKNVAATPMNAHNPLKPPMMDGFKPEIIRIMQLGLKSKIQAQGRFPRMPSQETVD